MNLDDPLDHLLDSWRAPAETPASFRQGIWQRIAGVPRASRAAWLAWWILQPRRAALLAAGVMALAVAWGLTHPPQPEISAHDAYVMSISPFDAHPPLRP